MPRGQDVYYYAPGRRTTLGREPARLLARAVGKPAAGGAASCRKLGASWMIEAYIRLGPGSADRMVACMRAGPRSRLASQVLAMLRSLHLGAGRR